MTKRGAKLSQDDAQLSDQIRTGLKALYANSCGSTYKSVSLSYQSELQKLIDNIIEKIYAGEMAAGDVDAAIYELVARELFKGVEKGYAVKLTKAKGADLAMLNKLKNNVYVFSGFKEYHFLREATDALYDEAGAMRSFSAFKESILKLNDKYNVDWLRTEYNHAIGSARMASKWVDISEGKDLYPYLQYVTAGDSRVRVSHKPLDGIVKHIDDPFWNKYYPPNDWNCRCTVKQVDEYPIDQVATSQLPELKEMFSMNSGKQGVIFPESHPYYKVLNQDSGKAGKNFGLKIPE
jgi:SPP1 gp7 family putative phage head morphogenesis protein